jgi:Family of unknown function (DUF5946)
MSMTRCPGCNALVPDVEGTVHAYVPSAPGCWKVFGEVQADESLRFGYPPEHRLVVDAYMAQHPGDGQDRRDRQSVFVHLIALCGLLERSVPPDRVTRLLGPVVRSRPDFPVLARPVDPGAVTLLRMVGAVDLDDYGARAREWASAVWDSWAHHHALIRAALSDAMQS